MAIAKRRAEDAHDRDVWLSWRTAMFARQERLTSPERWLAGRSTPPRPQTTEELLDVGKAYAAMGIGRITTRKEREAAAAATAARKAKQRDG